MLAKVNVISCNFSTLPSLFLRKPRSSIGFQTPNAELRIFQQKLASGFCTFPLSLNAKTSTPSISKTNYLQICHNSLNRQNLEDPDLRKEGGDGGNGNGGEERNWISSVLLFGLWSALMYYVFFLAPNQTPSTDMYFLKKLLNLKGDDGFQINEVIVSLWYIMGLWPLVYSMLLLPTGRSSKSNVPVWPFLVLSCFGGAYALIPYFAFWKPPPPPVEENQLKTWPLNFLESKLTAGICLAAGLALIGYAGIANGDVWKEFYQYFKGSRFIHVTCLDFTLLSAFAPFWVYNDMTARKWFDKGLWLLPLSLVPFLGPALYILLRPSPSPSPSVAAISQSSSEPK